MKPLTGFLDVSPGLVLCFSSLATEVNYEVIPTSEKSSQSAG